MSIQLKNSLPAATNVDGQKMRIDNKTKNNDKSFANYLEYPITTKSVQ